MRRLILFVIVLLLILGVWQAVRQYAPQYLKQIPENIVQQNQPLKIVTEESVTINTVKHVGPSVVTVAEISEQAIKGDSFSIFQTPEQDNLQQPEPQSIGSGFIISTDGLIVTNKHVVGQTNAKYQIITSNEKKYDVQKIYRDPLNDIAILKIDSGQNAGTSLQQVNLGDS